MRRASKPPAIALVRGDAPGGEPNPELWRRTKIYPSIDGTLILGVRDSDVDGAPVLFLVQMSTDAMLTCYSELVQLFEDFSRQHYPEMPNLTLAGSGAAGPSAGLTETRPVHDTHAGRIRRAGKRR